MKTLIASFSLLSLLGIQSLIFNSTSLSPSHIGSLTRQQRGQTAEDRRRADFEKARKLLLEKHVPFDPEILLTSDWRQTLRPVLDYNVPEFQETRRGSNRLKGVHLAHTLYLPEKVELEGDTVILVSNLIFEGHDAVIRGPYSVYVFPIDEAGVLGTSFEIASRGADVRFVKAGWSAGRASRPLPIIRGGSITIDTHGLGRADWLKSQQALASGKARMIRAGFFQQGDNKNGAWGSDGTWGSEGAQGATGSTGSTGSSGTCGNTTTVNGGTGGPGGTGGVGQAGIQEYRHRMAVPARTPAQSTFTFQIIPVVVTSLRLLGVVAGMAVLVAAGVKAALAELAVSAESARIALVIKVVQALVATVATVEVAAKPLMAARGETVATVATVVTLP